MSERYKLFSEHYIEFVFPDSEVGYSFSKPFGYSASACGHSHASAHRHKIAYVM